jgi:EmrB/QacA subfamily drug resistance transporter
MCQVQPSFLFSLLAVIVSHGIAPPEKPARSGKGTAGNVLSTFWAEELTKNQIISAQWSFSVKKLTKNHYNAKANCFNGDDDSYSCGESKLKGQVQLFTMKSEQTTTAVNQRSVLLTATLTSFLAPFMGSSVNIALPTIGREFSMNAVLLSWVTTAYLLAAAVCLVPFGRIADIYGRKRVYSTGMVVFTFTSLLSAFVRSPFELIALRVLHGVGSAMIFSTGVAILTSVFPAGERGKVLGINVASVYFGLSVGPFLGGFLTEHFGWRSIFLSTIIPALLILFFIFTKIEGEWAEAKGERFDGAGTVMYCLTMVALIYGLSLLPLILGAGMILIGVLGIIAFVKWELRLDSPVLAVNIFKENSVFKYSNVAAFINYSATFATGFILSLYLQYVKGLSPRGAGSIMIAQPIVMAIVSPYAGRLSDRIQPRIVASIGMALLTIGLFWFSFLSKSSSLHIIVLNLLLHGLGLGLFSSPNTNAVMGSVERKFFGVASGTLGTMRLTGMMFSMGIAMLIFSLYIGRVEITPACYPQFLKSVKMVFAIFTGLCFSGIFASLARGNMR